MGVGRAWRELGERRSSPRSSDPPSSPPVSLETLSTGTSPRLLTEDTRQALPWQRRDAQQQVRGGCHMPGADQSELRPGSRSVWAKVRLPLSSLPRQPLGANYRNCCRRAPECAGAGAGGWAGPERLSMQGREAGPSYLSNLAFASIIVIKAFIKRLLYTPTVREEGQLASGRGGEP